MPDLVKRPISLEKQNINGKFVGVLHLFLIGYLFFLFLTSPTTVAESFKKIQSILMFTYLALFLCIGVYVLLRKITERESSQFFVQTSLSLLALSAALTAFSYAIAKYLFDLYTVAINFFN